MDIKMTLQNIYNTLYTIDTHGNESKKMVACLDALEVVLKELDRQVNMNGEPEPAE